MSVARIKRLTIARNASAASLSNDSSTPCFFSKPSVTWACPFSFTLTSFQRVATSAAVVTRCAFDKPSCPTSCAAAATTIASACIGVIWSSNPLSSNTASACVTSAACVATSLRTPFASRRSNRSTTAPTTCRKIRLGCCASLADVDVDVVSESSHDARPRRTSRAARNLAHRVSNLSRDVAVVVVVVAGGGGGGVRMRVGSRMRRGLERGARRHPGAVRRRRRRRRGRVRRAREPDAVIERLLVERAAAGVVLREEIFRLVADLRERERHRGVPGAIAVVGFCCRVVVLLLLVVAVDDVVRDREDDRGVVEHPRGISHSPVRVHSRARGRVAEDLPERLQRELTHGELSLELRDVRAAADAEAAVTAGGALRATEPRRRRGRVAARERARGMSEERQRLLPSVRGDAASERARARARRRQRGRRLRRAGRRRVHHE
eukprot:30849-Pelagococcus_subviridis.AAC.5